MNRSEYFRSKSDEQLLQLYHELETAIVDAASCDGVETTGNRAELKEAISVLSEIAEPGAPGKREQQAKRAVLDEMQRRIKSGEGDWYIQKVSEELSRGVQEEEADARIMDPDVWKYFHDKFQALVEEELKFAPRNVDRRWLRAYVSERGKDSQIGCWKLSDGLNEGFQARFDVAATRAGVALGPAQNDNPRDFWLHRIFAHSLKRGSDLLFAADEHGGIILRACEASAVYCSRLEKRALEVAAEQKKPSGANRGGSLKRAARRARLRERLRTEVILETIVPSMDPGKRELVEAIQELLPVPSSGLPDSDKRGRPPVIPKMTAPIMEAEFWHSDSYQKLRFRGRDYDLTRHRRAAEVLRVMHAAHKNGEQRISIVEIRKAIQPSHGGNMYDWFRGTGLWKHLVIAVEKGVYRLDVPLPERTM